MTDIGDADDEDDGGDDGRGYDTPESPHKATATIGDAEKSDSNAAFNSNGARGVEELSNEEELLMMVSLIASGFQWKRASTHLGSLHDITNFQGGCKLARSQEAADNTQTRCDREEQLRCH